MNEPRNDLRDLFPPLDPPPHGLQRLRTRIDSERRARRRWQRVWIPATAAAAAASIIALVSIALPDPVELPPAIETSLLRMQIGLAEPPVEPVTLLPHVRDALAVRRVDLDTDRVVFYLVGRVDETDDRS
jgi:hypothetical protein